MRNDESATDISLFGVYLRNEWVRVVLAVNIVAVLVVVSFSLFDATKTATVVFNVVPVDATIEVNGGGVRYKNGSYRLHPGTYEIRISCDGLDTKTFFVDLRSGYNTPVTVFLSEGSNFGFYEFRDNHASFEKLSEIASPNNNQTTDHDTSAEEFILQQEQKNSISKFTPIRFAICENPATRVNCDAVEVTYDYSEKCDNQKCLIIKGRKEELTNDVITELTNQLSGRGYNLDNYRYIYEQDTEI